jgi:hypothetical protein
MKYKFYKNTIFLYYNLINPVMNQLHIYFLMLISFRLSIFFFFIVECFLMLIFPLYVIIYITI